MQDKPILKNKIIIIGGVSLSISNTYAPYTPESLLMLKKVKRSVYQDTHKEILLFLKDEICPYKPKNKDFIPFWRRCITINNSLYFLDYNGIVMCGKKQYWISPRSFFNLYTFIEHEDEDFSAIEF
jgi:hypothetical protein